MHAGPYSGKSRVLFLGLALFLAVAAMAQGDSLYRDQGDGTVVALGKGLVWQKCSAGLKGESCRQGKAQKMTWERARSYCRNLSLAGLKWRLPRRRELRSLVTADALSPAINPRYFPNAIAATYWAWNPGAKGRRCRAAVGFGLAAYSGCSCDKPRFYVRCLARSKTEPED